jgi:hypothetical protein
MLIKEKDTKFLLLLFKYKIPSFHYFLQVVYNFEI